jgi:hypothetical protein
MAEIVKILLVKCAITFCSRQVVMSNRPIRAMHIYMYYVFFLIAYMETRRVFYVDLCESFNLRYGH